MSYILDALRRADAERERERGAVPGLHAQPLSGDGQASARDRRPLLLVTAAGAILLAVVLLVIAFGPWSAHPAAVAVAPAAETPREQTPPVVAAAPEPAPAVQPAAPAPVVTAPATPLETARPSMAYRVSQTAQGRPLAAAPKPAAPKAPAVEHYGEPVAPAAKPGAVAKLAELPPDVRANLPKLTPGGAIYSDAAADRMLILNGQVYHEGDKPTPETTLEKIRHKSAVLNFRGTRYEIEF